MKRGALAFLLIVLALLAAFAGLDGFHHWYLDGESEAEGAEMRELVGHEARAEGDGD